MAETREIIGSTFINTTKSTGTEYLKGTFSYKVEELRKLPVDDKGQIHIKAVGFYKEKTDKEGKLVRYYYFCKDVPKEGAVAVASETKKTYTKKAVAKVDEESPF